MRCPICNTHMRITNTFEKRASVERRQACDTCPFRCHTIELISDTRAFIHAMRETVKRAAA